MNYVSAVYAVVVLIIAADWFVRGRRQYRGQDKRQAAAEEIVRHGSVLEPTQSLSSSSESDSDRRRKGPELVYH